MGSGCGEGGWWESVFFTRSVGTPLVTKTSSRRWSSGCLDSGSQKWWALSCIHLSTPVMVFDGGVSGRGCNGQCG